MSNLAQLDEACTLILSRLIESYPTQIELRDRDVGFFDNNEISENNDHQRNVLDGAFRHLKNAGLIEYSSEDGRTPRTDLTLTIEGFKAMGNEISVGSSGSNKKIKELIIHAGKKIKDKSLDTATSEVVKNIIHSLLT